MSDEWRNDPATDRQKEKLHFFGCTWDGGITKGQATDALKQCVQQFPQRESEWQNRPAAADQIEKLREAGVEAPPGLTYGGAKDLLASPPSRAVTYQTAASPPALAESGQEEVAQKHKRGLFGWVAEKLEHWKIRKAQAEAEKLRARAEWERQRHAYLASITADLRNGITPCGVPNGFVLQKGERLCWAERGVLHELKVVGRHYEGGSAGMSVRVMKGVRFNVGSSRGQLIGETGLVPVSDGYLIITNNRLAFVGDQKSFATKLEKLIGIQPARYGLQFSEIGKDKPKVVKYHDSQNGDIICEVLNFVLEG
jgi:hypothetical protein